MSKVEDRSLEALDMYAPKGINEQVGLVYTKSAMLGMFKEGYHQAEKDLTDKAKVSSGWDGFYYGQGYKQAEKDLELTWEDIERIDDILIRIRLDGTEEAKEMSYKEFYIEVLKQFKERKKK